jgi:hypothetical protein
MAKRILSNNRKSSKPVNLLTEQELRRLPHDELRAHIDALFAHLAHLEQLLTEREKTPAQPITQSVIVWN